MNRIDLNKYEKYSDLPLAEFQSINTFSIYVLDFNWNYLFVNDFLSTNLGKRGENLIGKNLWTEFKELSVHQGFVTLKENTERGESINLRITSPLTHQRLNIIGKPLIDCYFFYSSIMPDKDELIKELRNELKRK